jgi:4-carboxymuconolactone decarboxylase
VAESTSGAAETGRRIRNDMFGEETTTAQVTAGDPLFARLQEIVTETCFGETWARPALSLRDRSIATVAMLAALGREHELRTHIRGALSNGVSPDEIRELAIHAHLYAGLPAAFGAAAAANDVLTADEKAALS